MSESTDRVRRLGYGLVSGGILTLGLAQTALPAVRTAAIVLGFLGISALVLERTQSATPGVGVGFLTAAVGAVIWPRLGLTDVGQLGRVLVIAGAVNVVAAPLFARLQLAGERLGGGEGDGEETE